MDRCPKIEVARLGMWITPRLSPLQEEVPKGRDQRPPRETLAADEPTSAGLGPASLAREGEGGRRLSRPPRSARTSRRSPARPSPARPSRARSSRRSTARMHLADGALGGVGRVGGAHHFAVLGDGVLAFQHLHHGRGRRHELDEFAEERAVLVDGVEALGLAAAHPHALGARRRAGRHPPASGVIAPVRLRRVASGLIIEKVRSIAMLLKPRVRRGFRAP